MSNFSFTQFGALATDLLPSGQGKLINVGTNGQPGATTIVNIGSNGDTGVTINLCGNQLVSNGVPQYASNNSATLNNPVLNNATLNSFTATGSVPTWNQNTTGNANTSTTATNVAYTGLTGTVPTWNQNTTGTAASLNTSQTDILFTPQASAPTATRGAVWYDATLDALAYNNSLGEVALGQQVLLQYCYNNTGTTIAAGAAVYVAGQFGTSPSVALATAAALATSNVIGLAVVAIPNGTYGYVINQGVLINLNTSGFTAGQTLYLSASTPGGLVNTLPGTQFYNYRVAICTVSSATVGQVFVNIATAYVLPSAIVSPVTFTAQSTTYIPLQVYGFSSGQIADLFGVYNYLGGTKVLGISNTGLVTIPSATTTTQSATDNSTNIATTAYATTAVANAVANLAGKNVLINGDMSISQINGTTAVTPGTAYVIDMWGNILAQPSKLTFQQVTNKLNSLGAPFAELITTASAYTAASTEVFDFYQPIEGLNFSRFMYGSANAKAASLQFKANASLAGTYSGSIVNYTSTRSYVFTFVLAANTDTLVTIPSIPGDSGGTWAGATNAGAAYVRFDLGSGSTFRSSTINAWQAGSIVGATGSVSLVATLGATLAISEVQFELGPVCTSYERKLISQSLAECQRYLEIGTQLGLYIGTINVYAATAYGFIKFLSTKRAPPTMTYSSFQYYSSGIATTFTPNTNSATNDSVLYGSAALTNWNGWSAVGTWTADARL